MEVEKAVDHANGDKTATENAVEDLINEHKLENQPNGTTNGADAQSPGDKTADEGKGVVKGSTVDEKPSKRVQTGQRWNDRPRRYNDNNDRKFKKTNNKSDLVIQEESSDPVAIRKQVEFYFSDSNLLQDKFLFTKVEGHENQPVPISVIHSFRRMRHFQPLSAVIDALKESKTLNVVEDDTCIQRKEPLPEGLVGKPMVEIQKVHEDASMARSIYAKGFGDEEPSTQFDIEAFFANYGSTNSVRLRRTYDQSFKGSVFVEFDSEETQKSFLALESKPKWQGKELLIKSKKQYCDDKVDDIKAGKVRPNQHDRDRPHQNQHHKKRRDSPDYDQGGRTDEKDDRDWRVRREEDRKSGFKDRNGGKRRGYGSSGRGRGGRENRGPRDRNDERDNKDERGVPKVKTTASDSGDEGDTSNGASPKTPEKDQTSPRVGDDAPESNENGIKTVPTAAETSDEKTPNDGTSKKRAREEDEIPEEQGSGKKVDTKGGDS